MGAAEALGFLRAYGAEAPKFDETFEAEAIDPIIDDVLYLVDPVPPEDDAPT